MNDECANSVDKHGRVTLGQRLTAAGVFIAVLGIFALLFAGSQGWIEMSRLFGICGFKQIYGLPCAGCHMTTAAKAFAQGRIGESFYIQPAGAIFCCILVAIEVLALLISVFGVNFGFLHEPLTWQRIKYFIVFVLIILAAGWAVTLSRALAQNGGF
ncbi:MAG: DUF2752 domain-containing protein [Planctomycetota bacterium]|jgi:hypothetical protein